MVESKQGRRKTHARWDAAGNRGRRGKGDISTFFIPKFEDKWSAKDLYSVFKELGDIDEVIITPRRAPFKIV